MEAETALFSSLFSAIVIGGLAGWLAGKLVRGGGFGLIGNVILGIGGAFLANFALPLIGLGFGSGFLGSVISAMLGAAVVLIIIRLVKQV
ncbi:putative membrane protein YeaQ/YmgE (transglycosylase-associated protein family) [Shimia isoporae]|uniref:Putative membrane protein YeaQ/YmgE (Transglycosylase-associated protein family) n=1 Tax=Shimia isoporae TaxID=647720 RepID=A0A4R1NXB5_9RHOB|nr:GlsB/YeaQ/YmgE family stress response membrane protein [Shimia isoporae]TCL09812.1 putative membrane protein YeaQ/YmgE (transglycosylase-associated protein family) [Shimia isoporae]